MVLQKNFLPINIQIHLFILKVNSKETKGYLYEFLLDLKRMCPNSEKFSCISQLFCLLEKVYRMGYAMNLSCQDLKLLKFSRNLDDL